MTEQKIREILKQEAEIPELVEKQAFDALDRITSVECRRRTGGKKSGERYGWMHSVRAAAAALVVLTAVGTGVYAAGTYKGVFDFLADMGMTEMAGLEKTVDTGVDGVSFSNSYVDYTVREALCDENVIYMVVEAVPEASDQYLLVPQDCMEEDSVTYLGLETVTDGTIGEYAKLLDKELLYSSVGLFQKGELVSVTETSKMTEDGTVYYCITGVNSTGRDELELTCVGTAYTKEMAAARRAEAKCRVTNYSSSIKSRYMLQDGRLETETGIILDGIDITETGLGLYARFSYGAEGDAAEKLLQSGRWELTDASGNELAPMPYYAGSGLELFELEGGTGRTMTAAYQKTGMEQGMFAVFYDSETDTKYGPYEIKKQ